MPLRNYFKGKGEAVMQSMKKTYGPKAEEVFYATANKHGMKSESSTKKAMKKAMSK